MRAADLTVFGVESATWVTALVGLLGVIVGGLLQAIREVVLARRQERGEAVAAARLVNAEIVRTALILALARNEREWNFLAAVEGVHDRSWESEQGTLAKHLDDEAWRRVMWAYRQIDTVLILYNSDGRPQRMSEANADVIDGALWHLREANKLLLVASRKSRSERAAAAERALATPAWASTARPPDRQNRPD
jgi:hypothetical protein